MTDRPERIGSYPVERELGRGGMGIVYLGRDTRLDRPVAIKVLPEAFAGDPERLARFEREARLLAALNHPNIAGIYGLEEADGRRFLALEYVEGDTLAERLGRGALPLDEALEVGRQIAAALEAAHENGIIHRDLKPGNVKLAPGGEVKVLDFGLAKGAGTAESSPDLSQSPTMAYAATGVGVILGTAAYMSPEQARGKTVDRRTDIWSFGCVMYECLTGQQLFSGETVSDTIAKILEREPDWNAIPEQTPEKIRALVRRCLEKDAKKRLRDIGDARLELEEALAARTSSSRIAAAEVARAEQRAARAGSAGGPLAWIVTIAALGVAAVAILAPGLFHRVPERAAARLSVMAPAGSTLVEDAVGSAISPDGRMIALTAVDSAGTALLWVRALETLAARPLAGTEHASMPFWSPDSRLVGFFADGKLKKVPIVGGSVEDICDAQTGRGGTWNRHGVIVIAPAGEGPLFQVPADGGERRQVTSLDSTRHETAHRFPWFLPDGKHFLFVALPSRAGKFDVYVGSLDSPKRQHVMEAAGAPVFAEPGYLLFQRNQNLVAQKFDPRRMRLSGEPVALGDAPGGSNATGNRAVTPSIGGALAYINGRVVNTRLVWLDRSGEERGTLAAPPGRYGFTSLSPDGRLAAVDRDGGPGEADIWLLELGRAVATRFTYGPAQNRSPFWSPDGSRILFESDRKGPWDLYVKPTSGAVPETPLLESEALFKHPFQWSWDGRFTVFDQLDARSGWDVWVLPADGASKPAPYLQTPFDERWGSISPDGRWMAYTSNESGRFEIYVQSFPTPGNKYRVSTGGGGGGYWRKDGREILFFGADGLSVMAVDVQAGTTFHAGAPRALFRLPAGWNGLGAQPDFQRFLASLPAGDNAPSSITVVLDWTGALKKP